MLRRGILLVIPCSILAKLSDPSTTTNRSVHAIMRLTTFPKSELMDGFALDEELEEADRSRANEFSFG